MRREVPVERVLFATFLGATLLLLSLAMLRSDMHAPVASTQTFRDGFSVADRVERRTETASPSDKIDPLAASSSSSPVLRGSTIDTSASPVAPTIHVSGGADAHTTTIKLDDGDVVTIKRASTTNKITTISTHDDGKITIEKHDPVKHTVAPQALDTSVAPMDAKMAQATKRSVDFVGAYDAALGVDASDNDLENDAVDASIEQHQQTNVVGVTDVATAVAVNRRVDAIERDGR